LKLFDFNNPFFKPLALRIAVVAICTLWSVFEFVSGAPFWGVLFGGIAAIAFHGLFITFEPREPKSDETSEGQDNG